jgi:glycerophosphoryl diester phosphodiesterase
MMIGKNFEFIKTKRAIHLFFLIIVFVSSKQSIAQENFNFFQKPRNGNTYVIAHRGEHNGIPENTLAAYQKAIDLGCDFVEIDIRKTKDGKFVSVHNETIDAYTQGEVTGKVNDFTLAELKQLNIGKRVGPGWENERIPTFEEILQLCKGQIGIYLDLKEADVKAQIELIKSYGMERDVIWYIPASYIEVIKEVTRNCPECIVMPDPGEENNIKKVIEEVHPKVLATDMGELSASFVKTAHQYGVKIFTDDKKATPQEWEQILKWGTDGIQTDQPKKLIEILNKKQ